MYASTRLDPSAIHATLNQGEAQAPARKPFPAPGLALVLGLTLQDYLTARTALRKSLAEEAAEVRTQNRGLRGKEDGAPGAMHPALQSRREAARSRARAAHLALSALRGRDLRDVERTHHHPCPASAVQAALVLALDSAPLAGPRASKVIAQWCGGTPLATLLEDTAQASSGT